MNSSRAVSVAKRYGWVSWLVIALLTACGPQAALQPTLNATVRPVSPGNPVVGTVRPAPTATVLPSAAERPPTASASPVPDHSRDTYASIEELLIAYVGEAYYQAHYQLVDRLEVSPRLTKASYRFTYLPLVPDQSFVVFFDPTLGNLSDAEVSSVLLQPQDLKLDSAQALSLAANQGLEVDAALTTRLEFSTVIHRFVWIVTNPNLAQTAANQGRIFRMILDAETGQVFSTETIQPNTTQ